MSLNFPAPDPEQRADDYPVPAAAHVADQPMRHSTGKMAKPVKQARDRAQYVRQQKGHSFILHWFVLGMWSLFIVPIYYSVSPNHYWHA